MSQIPTEREVMFQLVDTARAMRTFVDQCARQHGMTRAQWGVLLRLERHEGMTQAEMADVLEITPISLVRLVDRLCELRLVERRPHASDRRANRLHLTAKGRSMLECMAPLGRELAGQVLAGFGEPEVRHLLPRLLRIKDNICAAAENAAARRADVGGRNAG